MRFDVSIAALAAIELGKTALEVWVAELDRVKDAEEGDEVLRRTTGSYEGSK